MRSSKSFLLASAALIASAPIAFAQPVTGVYLGAGLGVNWASDADISIDGALSPAAVAGGITQSGKVSYDLGWVALGSVGWGFGNGLRVEGEVSYRRNDLDGTSGFGQSNFSGSEGHRETIGTMVNLLYDFPVNWPVIPYIGIGAGYAWTSQVNAVSISSTGNQFNYRGVNGEFAYQGILGAAFPITAVPGLSLTAEYRYFATLDTDVDVKVTQANRPSQFLSGTTDNANNSVLIGLRYAFGVAPPPPPVVAPAAAPAPARTYLVFFDWNRADLTDRARQIIAEAAENSRRVELTRIEVNGFTDTSGSAQYNQGLSVRRAETVAAELARLGVPRSAMSIQGFGQTRLLVPTADNVREPQNRRVEIILR
ncbi:OmpA family protein [Humitalea sp. 24SJ18S-53]|uniref:OmpA family protein n=1 Tax=Humitalea sp. 24SJ18S-53 TaxID=3422307 RepID=UPI003D6680E5